MTARAYACLQATEWRIALRHACPDRRRASNDNGEG